MSSGSLLSSLALSTLCQPFSSVYTSTHWYLLWPRWSMHLWDSTRFACQRKAGDRANYPLVSNQLINQSVSQQNYHSTEMVML